MSDTTTAARVIKCIAEQSGHAVDYIKPADTFHSLELDSIDMVGIVMCIEDEFDFSSIPDDDAEKFSTVQDVIDYVTKEIEK